MKDLLDYLNADPGREQWRRGQTSVKRYVEGLDTRHVEDWLLEVWAADLREERAPRDQFHVPDEVGSMLPNDFRAAIDTDHGENLAWAAASIIKGRALGRALAAANPSYSLLEWCAIVSERCDWDAMSASFIDALSDSQAAAWKAVLMDPPADPNVYFYGASPGERLGLAEQARLWARERKTEPSAWRRRHGYAPVRDVGPINGLELLRRLDIESWLRAVDSLPLPGLTEAALGRDIDEDPENLLALIGVAPSVVEHVGAVTGSIVARMLCVRALELGTVVRDKLDMKARSTLSEDQAEVARWKAAAPAAVAEWYTRVTHAIGVRDDGNYLLVDLACDFLHRAARPRPGHGDFRDEEAARAANAASLELSKSASSKAFIYAQWQCREQIARQPTTQDDVEKLAADGLPYFVLTVSTETDKLDATPRGFPLPSTIADEMWSWLDQLMTGEDPSINSCVEHPTELAAEISAAAHVLASASDPAQKWRASWRGLEEQRYAGLADHRESARSSWSPSRFLVSVAARSRQYECLTTFCAPSKVEWNEIFDAAIYIALRTGRWDSVDHPLAWFAGIARMTPGVVDNNPVGNVIRYLVGDAHAAVSAALMLHVNGFAIAQLDAAFTRSGIDLLAYVAAARAGVPAKHLKPEPLETLVEAVTASRALVASPVAGG